MSTTLKVEAETVHWRELDGELIGLAVAGSTYFALNGTATVLWKELVGGTTAERLRDVLCTQYAVDRDEAARDVDAFLTGVRGLGVELG